MLSSSSVCVHDYLGPISQMNGKYIFCMSLYIFPAKKYVHVHFFNSAPTRIFFQKVWPVFFLEQSQRYLHRRMFLFFLEQLYSNLSLAHENYPIALELVPLISTYMQRIHHGRLVHV